MSIRALASHAIWALIAVIAFFAGHFTTDPPAAPTVLSSATVAPTVQAVRNDAPVGFTESAPISPGTLALLTRDQVRVRTFELLSIPDRLERMRQLCALFRSVTAENWRELLDAFSREILATGGIHREEWSLALLRVGQVAGSAAIQEALDSGKVAEKDRAPLLLTGWAESDPKAAMAWLDGQAPEVQGVLTVSLINGLARSDPQSALTLMAARLPEQRDTLVPRIVDGMIQRGGFRAAEEMLATFPGRADIPSPVKGAIYGNMAMRQIEMARMRGEPATVLAWANAYIGPDGLGPVAMKQIVNFAAVSDARGTMNWVEARAGRWTQQQEAVIYPIIAQSMQAQAPEELAAWMNANSQHPQRDIVAQSVAQRLIEAGNLEQAAQWTQAISDTAIRASLEQKLKVTEEKLRNAKVQ